LFTNSENQTPTGENVDNNLIAGQNANPQLVIIEDPQCLICNTDYFAEQVKQNLMPDLEITKIDYTENEAQLLLNIAGVPFLPLYIFDDKITQRPDWEQMSSSFLPLELNERTFY